MEIAAIYENGVFRPETPVELPPGTPVVVNVVSISEELSDDEIVARMKARFPEITGCMSDEQAQELRAIIEDAYGQVNPDDWR